jgi:radical SAM superfamily enzyme YgiQ (UPF0313 family)
LFKDPESLIEATLDAPPDLIGFASYYWSQNLVAWAVQKVKAIAPFCTVVVGGPNVDSNPEAQYKYFKSLSGSCDYLVSGEGEIGFSNIVAAMLGDHQGRISENPIDGAIWFDGQTRVAGAPVGVVDMDKLPSPILSGLLDEFYAANYLPLLETSRHCPYQCTFCTTGKDFGKIRTFSLDRIKAEMDYLCEKNRHNPYGRFYITDQNFGINKQDEQVAEIIFEYANKYEYPKHLGLYFDKKFTDRTRKIARLLFDLQDATYPIPLQSLSVETLSTINRKNIRIDNIDEIIAWANDANFEVVSELIFGLPHETKKTFLDAVEFCIKRNIRLVVHNLMAFPGAELFRDSEIEKNSYEIKRRPAYVPSTQEISGEVVSDLDDIVVSSNCFSFDDFMDIRKIGFAVYAFSNSGYYKRVIDFLVSRDYRIVDIFDCLMNPEREEGSSVEHQKFINDLADAMEQELHETKEGALSSLEKEYRANGNKITQPTRLNPLFSSRLIFGEDWLGKHLRGKLGAQLNGELNIFNDLLDLSSKEWLDLENPEKTRLVTVCADTVDYLNFDGGTSGAEGNHVLLLEASDDQIEMIHEEGRKCSDGQQSVFLSGAHYIPMKRLRYHISGVEAA